MLMLTRYVGERAQIGNDINITVVTLKRGQVVVGIDAPQNVSVHREEIYVRLNRKQPARFANAPYIRIEYE